MAGRRGSVCVPSSAERKYLTENAIRLIASKLSVSGREALESEQPAQASESGASPPSPSCRREAGATASERHEGGPTGPDRDVPAGRSRGGRGAVAGRSRCRKHVAEYDSPPGRWDVYEDLDAGEGQQHG
jgi:hypothetical protein